ncbi:uncharacterized protein At4g06744-like [Telopea speciosissima]|uniref:uncharacterized protein At4g06744-like n=1 Tax=Telopea speciosissima TaxID=54955 RepID=UPI001CC4F24C|nr:uncharacterized protein At4g06744-like [Telopea speciosissima]
MGVFFVGTSLTLRQCPLSLFVCHVFPYGSFHMGKRILSNFRGTKCPPEPPPQTLPDLLTFADQRLAIVYPVIQTFKKTITSDPLGVTKTWVGSDICNYKGFFCDSPPDNRTATAVASIDFNGFGLTAPTLDGFLDQLLDIAVFHANSNNFTGTVSPKISQLRYLYELDFSNNNFSGKFPTAVVNMVGLSFLDIRFNSFTGSIPAQVFTQTLDLLFVNNNNFMEKLPDNLGNTSVRYLTLANNKFMGPIPKSIGKAANTLVEVLFLNNQLSGCLPYEIGLLVEATVFDASLNQLTGPLPCSLGCLEKIEQLNFAGNQLYGAVPEVVCALGNLENLSLSDNYFTHVGPICRNLIKRRVLDVRKNCIQDLSSQRSVAECALFFAHPRICLNLLSYSIIPCKSSHWPFPFPWKFPPRSSSAQSKQPKAPSPSYSALIKHRL